MNKGYQQRMPLTAATIRSMNTNIKCKPNYYTLQAIVVSIIGCLAIVLILL